MRTYLCEVTKGASSVWTYLCEVTKGACSVWTYLCEVTSRGRSAGRPPRSADPGLGAPPPPTSGLWDMEVNEYHDVYRTRRFDTCSMSAICQYYS